ncbi:MAG TPA: chemotaxis protein CheW [Longimicrobiaceae bacterium]|nr:chemotaxis protein CheW [Longimicrobiaceae bacterium]
MFQDPEKELPDTGGNAGERADSSRVVLLPAGSQFFGIPVASVREVIPARIATPLPGAAECVRGLINLRGTIVTVFSLSGLLRLSESDSAAEKSIVLVEHGERVVGLETERAVRILRVPSHEAEAPGDVRMIRDPDKVAAGEGREWCDVYTMLNIDDLLTPQFH